METRAPHTERIGGFGTALNAISIARDTAAAGAEQTLAYRVVFVGWFTYMTFIVVPSSCPFSESVGITTRQKPSYPPPRLRGNTYHEIAFGVGQRAGLYTRLLTTHAHLRQSHKVDPNPKRPHYYCRKKRCHARTNIPAL